MLVSFNNNNNKKERPEGDQHFVKNPHFDSQPTCPSTGAKTCYCSDDLHWAANQQLCMEIWERGEGHAKLYAALNKNYKKKLKYFLKKAFSSHMNTC